MTRPAPETSEHRSGWAAKVAAVLAVLALAGAAAILFWPSATSAEVREVVVPAGTQERIDAGETIELLPGTFEVSVGDRLIIVNDDNATHQVGPYIVGPGQRIEQQVLGPGRIEGVCTLHPSGEVAIVVR